MLLLGIVCQAVGVVLLLRAASLLRPDLVTKLTMAGPPARAQGRGPAGTGPGRRRWPPRVLRSFEEEVAALTDQLGRGDGGGRER